MLNYFCQNIIKHDLLNKFNYWTLKDIPKIIKTILTFKSNYLKLKEITKFLLVLELVANNKSNVIKSKVYNLTIKLKKGMPIGCKITLHKKSLYYFLTKLIFEIFPKNTNEFLNLKNNLQLTLKLKNLISFFEIENKYYLFNNVNNLNIAILTTANTQKELIFLLSSLKLLIKKQL